MVIGVTYTGQSVSATLSPIFADASSMSPSASGQHPLSGLLVAAQVRLDVQRAAVSMASVRPSASNLPKCFGKFSFICPSFDERLCIHFAPVDASARRTAMALGDENRCRNSVFAQVLERLRRVEVFRRDLGTLTDCIHSLTSLLSSPLRKTTLSSSPSAPALLLNSAVVIGFDCVILPVLSHSPRLRSAIGPLMTAGLPGRFLAARDRVLPRTLVPHIHGAALERARERVSVDLLQKATARAEVHGVGAEAVREEEASMSPTVSRAMPSPCSTRICWPANRRNGLPRMPVLSRILSTTVLHAAARGSTFPSGLGGTSP